MQMRLSRSEGKWIMEGKNGTAAPWKNISCETGCGYRASTSAEQETYLTSFPGEMSKQFDIACIQNMASAFCRLTKKDDASKTHYAFVALVMGKPIPMSLQRLTAPESSNPAVSPEAARKSSAAHARWDDSPPSPKPGGLSGL